MVSLFFKWRLPLFLIFIFSSVIQAQAQLNAIYKYQDLSHQSYAKQKDSIKKFWTCPSLYSEKETQKKYKELWDDRVEYISKSIENDNYIQEKEISDYISNIISDLIKGNPKLIKTTPMLLIDRSSVVNAYAIGGNIIAVNLGLISFASTREEIALVIAHELSHNILDHAEKSMKEKAEWLTSDEYKKSLNSVLDSKYERFTRLKKLFEGYTIDRSKHHRYHESDADSLAIILLKNSRIGFDAKFFLKLDSADIQYKQPLKDPIKNYFTYYNLPFEDWWLEKKSKGLSTRNYSFKDTTSLEDSMKTHPDCLARYNATVKQSDENILFTPIPTTVKEKTQKIIIWNMFDNLNLTASLYRIFLEKDKNNTDPWYDFMVHNILQGLYYSDRQLNRFNAIGIIPKEYISRDYYSLQNLFEQIPTESLEKYCRSLQSLSFWQKLPADANSLKSLFASLNFDEDKSEKNRMKLAKDFTTSYNESMYCEFAEHFNKK